MSSAFAVEVDRRVVGMAVRVAGGFRFFSSDPRFFPFEGRVFRKGRSIGRRLAEFIGSRRPEVGDQARSRSTR
jgi:hypothetical protein